MIFTDLREIKSVLEIDPNDTSEDKRLLFFIEHASNIIEEFCARDFSFKTRTQYYNGTGTQKLVLRSRPVYPSPPPPYTAITVTVDENGFFGAASGAFTSADGTSTTLTYGSNYTLQIDQDDGSSRSGILYRLNAYWDRPQVRQAGLLSPFIGPDTGSIQVIYTAGYSNDTVPAMIREACNLIVARLRYVWPLGVELNSESYEERSMSVVTSEKNTLITLAKPLLLNFRNWHWG
ncbi:MAG: hypothetical protein KGL39_12580 [Patescibacteria group bacterium]|nr:hypothetical protein [Patescibacteria group bacterium]